MTLSMAQLLDLAHRHAEAEANGDIEATLATMHGEQPVYCFPVQALMFSGEAATRRYYENFFNEVGPRVQGFELLGEWQGASGCAQEYRIWYRGDDNREQVFQVLGILGFGSRALSGEHIYANEAFVRILCGPLWDELLPMPFEQQRQ